MSYNPISLPMIRSRFFSVYVGTEWSKIEASHVHTGIYPSSICRAMVCLGTIDFKLILSTINSVHRYFATKKATRLR